MSETGSQLQRIDIGVLGGQIAHVGSRIDLRAGDAAHHLLGLKFRSMPVDFVHQPAAQLSELTLADLFADIRQVGLDAFPQLGRDQVPQGVGGVIADIFFIRPTVNAITVLLFILWLSVCI